MMMIHKDHTKNQIYRPHKILLIWVIRWANFRKISNVMMNKKNIGKSGISALEIIDFDSNIEGLDFFL